ncbi:MAG: hypothetical protein R2867_01110 [Caldilineaceae bacterium]
MKRLANPLALRLVIGLLNRHPLKGILTDLLAARGQQIEALYTHIYGHAWTQDRSSRMYWSPCRLSARRAAVWKCWRPCVN